VGAIIRTDLGTREQCLQITEASIPAVVLADQFDSSSVLTMRIDSGNATRQAIEHLIHLGHRRIAVVLNVVDDHDHLQRMEAYRGAMEAASMRVIEKYVLRAPARISGGETVLRQIMTMPARPTAVFVMDPLTAVGLFDEAKRCGVRIPTELSVIGFDDARQRLSVYPRMSAVCQDAQALGTTAIQALHRLIRAPAAELRPAKLECWLELNESTAEPPALRQAKR